MEMLKAFYFGSLFFLVLLPGCQNAVDKGVVVNSSVTIMYSVKASMQERLAVKEIRRYVYLRSGELLETDAGVSLPKCGDVIVVANKKSELINSLPAILTENIGVGEYIIKTVSDGNRKILIIAGGDSIGTLYGAYQFVEHLGVRFYLHGDTIPDVRKAFSLPDIEEVDRPLFKLRGIQPFHDFPEGPDWWNIDDYKAFISQLPKLRMNFIGLHCYPEGGVGPEPTVWIGLDKDVADDGQVNFSYPSHYAHTMRDGVFGYSCKKTSNFSCGASQLFEKDGFGPEVMDKQLPEANDIEACNAVFNRTGAMLREAFTHAQKLGVKTCLGTETPLKIPKTVQEIIKNQGKNPETPAVVKEIYEGMFQRIMKMHPLDYYWLWTREQWTWEQKHKIPVTEIEAVKKDMKLAFEAIQNVKAPFTMATCGWVLGPPGDRSGFDKLLPKEVPLACINRHVGYEPVEPAFAQVRNRDLWAIPWLEDDPDMIAPQLWVSRVRRDAADALEYGCSGLMGIHWRTRVLGPNIKALAQAGWNQNGWNPRVENKTEDKKLPGNLPAGDFYTDWALSQFGVSVAKQVAKVFVQLDGMAPAAEASYQRPIMPRPSGWLKGPGGIHVNHTPWEEAKKDYLFVDVLEGLRDKIRGKGNIERFDYWLNSFRYMRSMAQLGCTRGELDKIMKKINALKDEQVKKEVAVRKALPVRIELARLWEQLMQYQLARVTNSAELGEIANLEQHNLIKLEFMNLHDKTLRKILERQLPPEIKPSMEYIGSPEIIVPTRRSQVEKGESLKLRVIIPGSKPVKKAVLYWRPMGKGRFQKIPLNHIARAVYTVTLPPAEDDFEYYIRAKGGGGEKLVFPATAPQINQTVILSSE